MRPIIVTTVRLPEEGVRILNEVGDLRGPEDWRDHLPSAEALISIVAIRIGPEELSAAPRLRIVANAAVGYDNIDLDACRARGLVVTNTPDVLTDATADIAMALVLSAVRQLTREETRLRTGRFQGWTFWDDLSGDVTGSTLGIFGMGRIGQAVARRAAPFGMSILYNSRSRLDPETEKALSATWTEWEDLLERSDVLSLHAPYSAATHHVVDRAALARMKRGSYLVNTARGPLVDEEALAEALREGRLAGAGLDVYEREPEVHPGLLELSNVTLLPHVGSATQATRTAMAMLAVRNVSSVMEGREPITRVV